MPDETDKSAARKHRVIHWNPDTGAAPVQKRWTLPRILAWSALSFVALLFVAGGVIRLYKLLARPYLSQAAAGGAATTTTDPNLAFVSQSKAELAHENVGKALAEMRRLPQDHPVQLQKLIVIEKAYIAGESLLASREFNKAYAHFTELSREIDEFSRSIKAKHDAQQSYDSLLVKIQNLDRARSLAPEALDRAFAAAGASQEFMKRGSFIAAKKTLDDGFEQIAVAEKALANYVTENLRRGQQALSNGRREEAANAFKAALEKSPGNEVALQGMKRSETIDRVHSFLKEGEALENKAQYAQAAEAYKKAFALDPFSSTAQEGQSRAARLEKETKFGAAFSAAQDAFKRRAWSEAIAEYENALKVYPNKPDVQALLKTARQNAHADAVQKALAKAYAYENQHEWLEARKAYDETLKLDPNQTEAREGHVRAGQMLRNLLQFETYVDRAQQRANRAEFQAAIREFNDAMAIKPAYLVLNDKVQQLHALLMSQNKPVDVTFESDGKTHVSIVNFRNMGKITKTNLKILPGDYDVIGRRSGYQDVHLILQVRNGSPPPIVTVACTLRTDRR